MNHRKDLMVKHCKLCPFRLDCLVEEPGGACLLVREIVFLMVENETFGELKRVFSTNDYSADEIRKREIVLERYERYVYRNVYDVIDAVIEKELIEEEDDNDNDG